jgi:hypothetical protein
MPHGIVEQVQMPLKLRQQRTLVLHPPIFTQPDVLQFGFATSAGWSWPAGPAALCVAVAA